MEEFWNFVEQNAKADTDRLRLKYHGREMPFDIELAITQIECRKRFATKLAHTLQVAPRWIFPSLLAGEQSTGDLAAAFHASLIDTGCNVADLTSGLGIDALHFAEKCASVTAVEIDSRKSELLATNAKSAGLDNLHSVCADCRDFITACDSKLDTIFIDPARRAANGSRVFSLSQCKPDVTSMLVDIKRITPRLIVKMSPMLDISQTVALLPGTMTVYSVGTATECKELVADLTNEREQSVARYSSTERRERCDEVYIRFAENCNPAISAVTLGERTSTFTFTAEEERHTECTYATTGDIKAGDYIYEPYPAVMKAAPVKLLSRRYNVKKIHPNTHLYVSDTLRNDFPGEIRRIIDIVPFESKYIKRLSQKYPQLQISTRNFPFTPDRLRAKLRVKDSGNLRLFAVTALPDTPLMIITEPQ